MVDLTSLVAICRLVAYTVLPAGRGRLARQAQLSDGGVHRAEAVIGEGDSGSDPYRTSRPARVHAEARSSQYGYVSRQIRETVESFIESASLRSGARVLDFGCATKPYRSLFAATVEYLGADLAGNPAADVVIDANGRLDAHSGSFDLVLSTQVLEHVSSPALYLDEARRVLRPGGVLLLTTHGLMYFHRDPEDYWRWTADGLNKILVDAAFDVVRMEGLVGLAPTALQLFQDATCRHLPRRLWKPYVYSFQSLIEFADRRYSAETRRDNSLVIGALARIPEARLQ